MRFTSLSGWSVVASLALGLLSLGMMSLVGCRSETSVPPAETILTNGHIFTSNPAAPWTEAVAVREGKILALGANTDVAKYQSTGTRVIDLHGRMAMPGIIDNHTHFLWASYGLAGLQLRRGQDAGGHEEARP